MKRRNDVPVDYFIIEARKQARERGEDNELAENIAPLSLAWAVKNEERDNV